MKANTRLIRRVAVFGLALLAAIDTAAWVIACRQLETRIDTAELGGWQVTAGSRHWRGWPMAATVDLTAVVAEPGPAAFPPGLVWRAETVLVSLSLLHPRTLMIDAPGRQSVAAPGLPLLALDSRRTEFAVDLVGDVPPTLKAEAIAFGLPGSPVSISALTLSFDGARTRGEATGIDVGHTRIASLRTAVRISPPFPFAFTAAESAGRWHDLGGRVTIEDAAVDWTGLTATATGSGGLDAALQPEGRMDVTSSAFPALIDQLVDAGLLTRQPALAAKAVLTLLAAPAKGGPVTLPITLADGILRVAGIAVLRTPAIAWR